MKSELILLSATLALAGCAHNRGTAESSPEAAYGSGSSTTPDTGSLATQPDVSSGQGTSNHNLNQPATQPQAEPIPAPGLEAAQTTEPDADQPADIDQGDSNLPDEDVGAMEPAPDQDNSDAADIDQDNSNAPDEDADSMEAAPDQDHSGPADQDEAEPEDQTPGVAQPGPAFTGPTKPERA